MYRIETTHAAEVILTRVPGLRERIDDMLTGILQTAEEFRRLHGHGFDPAGQHLRVQVSGYLVSYQLDLDRHAATVAFIERLDERGGEGSSSAA